MIYEPSDNATTAALIAFGIKEADHVLHAGDMHLAIIAACEIDKDAITHNAVLAEQERCVKAARAAIDSCRFDGESDLRAAKARVEQSILKGSWQ